MTDAEKIAAIRRQHLKANIAEFQGRRGFRLHWDRAWLDPGFGDGPYVKLPVTYHGQGIDDEFVVRVYPTARLRRKLNA